tara:strand:+ start:452 stop:1048 length:597 start_codon:yes stop_codon:yes gene_type:complete
MSLFISNENQEILWKVINNNPYISEMDLSFKIEWFKQTIGIFFDEYKEKKINKEELKKINKDFIERIAKDVKYLIELEEKERERIKEMEMKLEKENEKRNEFVLETISERLAPQSEEINNKYNERQENYNKLLEKNVPNEINFSEDINDNKITDMEELLEKERKQREEVDKEAHRMYEEYVNKNDIKVEGEIETVEPN